MATRARIKSSCISTENESPSKFIEYTSISFSIALKSSILSYFSSEEGSNFEYLSSDDFEKPMIERCLLIN